LYPGEYAIIEVADSGHGIPPEIQREIFEPFFTTKPAGKGTGLGLSTAMDLIRRSGGFITVTSTEGTGSTFTLYLPVVDEATTSEDFDPSEPRLVNSNGASIMVIDDEPAIRRSTSLSLTRLGYHVEAFRHGAEALSRMETEPPDVILLDMIMPGMSGRQVFEQVQLLEDPPPVILTTGYAESDDILFMLEQGLSTVIAKPYKAAKVAAEIERALTEHNSASWLAESMRDAISRPNDQAPSAPQRSSPRLHL
jgi:two-component system, cell cycle sensor histidine kinase and response regulator CckA